MSELAVLLNGQIHTRQSWILDFPIMRKLREY
jgi:hypothetical protein